MGLADAHEDGNGETSVKVVCATFEKQRRRGTTPHQSNHLSLGSQSTIKHERDYSLVIAKPKPTGLDDTAVTRFHFHIYYMFLLKSFTPLHCCIVESKRLALGPHYSCKARQ